MVFHYDSSDPLAIVTAPPPNETPDEKAAREEREAEAQRISDQIDDELRAEKVALKKQEQIVKILLLGQSESGESTLDIQLGAYPAPGSASLSCSRITADGPVIYSVQQGNLPPSRVGDTPGSAPCSSADNACQIFE